MLFIRAILLLILFFLFQITLSPIFQIGYVMPNVLLIMVLLYGIHFGIIKGVIWGVLTGILVDSIIGASIGVYFWIYLFCGGIAGIFKKQMYREHWFTIILLTGGGTLLEGVIIGLFEGYNNLIFIFLNIFLPGLLYNILVSLPIGYLLNYLLEQKPSYRQIFYEI